MERAYGIVLREPGGVSFFYMKVVRLFFKYANPAIGGYAKMTLSYTMKMPSGDIKLTLGSAIPYTDCESHDK